MEEHRKKLNEGTVIREWQDDSGQWWQDTVVKDTAKITKIITRRINSPSGESGKAGTEQ